MTETQRETRRFEAEVGQILRLMIHSMYSNKEVFLRELISNASDAIDKLRFEALSNEALFEGDSELKIEIRYDKDARTIIINDNGIGMSREEVNENIGTIARSGTKAFLDRLTGDQAKDAQLIGQFGVGFYSAFIVADKVILTTRRAGDTQATRWESTGEGDYSIENAEKDTRGTEIILHLREDEDEFLNDYRLEAVIRKYSDHISFPIILHKDDEETTVNQASALWTRSKSDITQEEYSEFYKHVGHDFQDPLTYLHAQIEGRLRYTLLLFVPARRPYDMLSGFEGKNHGVKLYVRRVFITDDADIFMPRYLRFVRGVVDSDDLPLNVSRELLQDNRLVDSMRKTATKRILSTLEELANNEPEKYATFWSTFGTILKEGVVEDHERQSQIAKLLRFASTQNSDDAQTVSLDDYIARMKDSQDKIYYVTADSYAAAKNSPHLEVFQKHGVEVLLLSDAIDEWLVSHLENYDGKELQSVASGQLDLGEIESDEQKEQLEQVSQEFQPLLDAIKDTLGDRIKDVRLTHRLTSSPACLVTEQGDLSNHMRRVLQAVGQDAGNAQPILELNPDHALIQKLHHDRENDKFADWTEVIFDQALLSEGGQLQDPATFVKRLNELMVGLMS